MLICASCKEPMAILELEGVEIDYCFNCGSIWLDKGELELLVHKNGDNIVSSLFREISSETLKEKSKKCPICNRKMKKIKGCEDKFCTVLDVCSLNHGIWFDKGELMTLVEELSGADNRIVDFLKSVFSNK